MKQGDFAVQTNGDGVYCKDGAYFQCCGMSTARELHVRSDHTVQPGLAFAPDPLEEVEPVGSLDAFATTVLRSVSDAFGVDVTGHGRKVGMGYEGWRTAPPYTEEVGKAAEKYCSSFTFAVRTPATWRWQELYDLMVAAALDSECPIGDVVRENIDAQTDRARERMAAAQLVADDEPIETTTGNSIAYDEESFQYVERPPMTLNEIVAAVRTNELVTGRDMRYAIVAFDVLMSQLHIDQHVAQLQEYFKAATAVPREYAGHMNDPEKPEAVQWYKAMQGVSES